MADLSKKRSPIHHLVQSRAPTWNHARDVPIALSIETDHTDWMTSHNVGICDLSGLSKLGVKGSDAGSWLESMKIEVPEILYDSRIIEDGGLIIRIASDEFFIEGGITNHDVPMIASELASSSGRVFGVERHEATIMIIGSQAVDVMAQTCGINFADAISRRLIYSRIAGVSCGIFPETIRELPAYRLWVDPSYAVYLWETLEQICQELGGQAIGAGCLYPDWV